MKKVILILFVCLFATPSVAQNNEIPKAVKVEPLNPETPTRPVELTKVVVDLSRGERFGQIKGGWLCVGQETLVWRSGRSQLNPEEFNEVFEEELEAIGFDVVGVSTNLFDEGNNTRAEYLVGGTIKSIEVDACLPSIGFGNASKIKGQAFLEVEWQLYDRLNRRVVDKYTTRTGYKQKKSASGGFDGIVFAAFAENVRALAASGKLQNLLVGERADLNVARVANPKFEVISLDNSAAKSMTLPDAVGSTVLVLSGNGHGSGLLISEKGYFLTNAHVVGNAKYVKIRWSDGVEGVGEVIRKDTGRDIALLQAESRGRSAILLSDRPISVGDSVFAIGAPLDTQLQNTVTKGILSANRILDGYSYIQSDVSVVPGNSGGPLVDENARLLGITVSGIRVNEAPQGVNLFIPAQEAFDFLNLKSSK